MNGGRVARASPSNLELAEGLRTVNMFYRYVLFAAVERRQCDYIKIVSGPSGTLN